MVEELKAVIFRIRQEEYAISISQVVSIERLQIGTKLPKMPSYVSGVVELRGAVIPLIDLRVALNDEEPQNHDQTRIIVVNVNEQHVGLIVDAATDVLDIPLESIQNPRVAVNEEHSFIKGIARVGNRLLILLEMKELLQNVSSLELLKDIAGEFKTAGIA